MGKTQFARYKDLHRNVEVKTVLGITALALVMKKKIDKGEIFHLEPDEEKELFLDYAIPTEMSLDDLNWGGFKKLFKEKNNIK